MAFLLTAICTPVIKTIALLFQASPPYSVDPYHAKKQASSTVEKIDYSTWPIVKLVQYGIFSHVRRLVDPKAIRQRRSDSIDTDINIVTVDVNQLDDEGVSLLHWAAINNRLRIARLLLSLGAQVDRLGGDLAATPLHWATRQSNLGMIHLLMRHGADPYAFDNQGLACIHVAVQLSSLQVVAYFLARGVPTDFRDHQSLTPLMYACMHRRESDLLRFLIAWGSTLSSTDSGGNAATHYAIQFANIHAVNALEKAGASWEAINAKGERPYEVRDIPRLNERLRGLAKAGQAPPPSAGCRQRLAHAAGTPAWRQRTVALLPGVFLLVAAFILSLGIHAGLSARSAWFAGSYFGSRPTLTDWTVKFVLLVGVGHGAQRLLHRYSDYRSQLVLPFSVAVSCTVLLTAAYLFHLAPALSAHWLLHLAFVAVTTLVWVTFYRSVTSDPGIIDRAPDSVSRQATIVRLVDEAMADFDAELNIDSSETDDQVDDGGRLGRRNPLDRFCTSCLVRKPLRSKHCATCDRCVARFDHHCPWIYNCVGCGNHAVFTVYLAATAMSCVLFVYATYVFVGGDAGCWHGSENSGWVSRLFTGLRCHAFASFCCLQAGLFAVWTSLLFATQLYQMVWLNATTNERINIDRYVEFAGISLDLLYSGGGGGQPSEQNSPYNRGLLRNALDLFGRPGYGFGRVRFDWRRCYDLASLPDVRQRSSTSGGLAV